MVVVATAMARMAPVARMVAVAWMVVTVTVVATRVEGGQQAAALVPTLVAAVERWAAVQTATTTVCKVVELVLSHTASQKYLLHRKGQ